MTKILTAEEITEMLKTIAHTEEAIAIQAFQAIKELTREKEELKRRLADVNDSLELYKTGRAIHIRESFKQAFDAHLQAGGAVDVHPRIKIRRNSKWMYDQKKALAWAQENGIRDVIRVKESLVKLAFDKLIDEGHYQDVEQVKSVSIILPSVMGDLLIESQEKE